MLALALVGSVSGPWDAMIVALNVAQTVALAVIAARSRRVRRSDSSRSRARARKLPERPQ